MRYALVCKDDVRDATVKHDARVINDIRAAYPEANIVVDSNESTYEAMFAVGLTQLRVGAAGVVLESPLGRVALGQRAVEVAREAQALCVLVDCFAERSVWEARLAHRSRGGTGHRPVDVEWIVNHYGDIEYELMGVDGHVRVDTAADTEDSVMQVKKVIDALLLDEQGSSDRISC